MSGDECSHDWEFKSHQTHPPDGQTYTNQYECAKCGRKRQDTYELSNRQEWPGDVQPGDLVEVSTGAYEVVTYTADGGAHSGEHHDVTAPATGIVAYTTWAGHEMLTVSLQVADGHVMVAVAPEDLNGKRAAGHREEEVYA
jgi:hypothetical protein